MSNLWAESAGWKSNLFVEIEVVTVRLDPGRWLWCEDQAAQAEPPSLDCLEKRRVSVVEGLDYRSPRLTEVRFRDQLGVCSILFNPIEIFYEPLISQVVQRPLANH